MSKIIELNYKRTRAPRSEVVTCPCCLKSFKAKGDGTVTRHGWTTNGRQKGQYGYGYQFGECAGWGMRPLEETDEDARKMYDGWAEQKAGYEEMRREAEKQKLFTHFETVRHYPFDLNRQGFDSFKERNQFICDQLAAQGIPTLVCEEIEESIRPRRMAATVFVCTFIEGQPNNEVTQYYKEQLTTVCYAPKGYQQEVVRVPSFETVKQSEIRRLDVLVSRCDRFMREIATKIEWHYNNPSSWHLAAQGGE